MATTKSFKISLLPEMALSSIDNNDLFLVSDHIGGKYPFESKKLLVGTYSNYIKAKVKTDLAPYISSLVEQTVQDALSAALSGESFDIILKNALDRISDGRQDETILVNGGSSETGGPVYDI